MRALLLAAALLAPLPALAAEGFVQGLNDGYPLCLIASVSDGAISPLPDPEVEIPGELGPRTWHLANLTGAAGEAQGSAPIEGECGCISMPQVSLSPPPALAGNAIATNLPLRPAAKLEQLSPESATYVKAARAWLDSQGLTKAPVRLTHVLRTDLEGDGVDEVLLAGAYNALAVEGADMRVGRYAFLLLRKLVNGQVVTSPLEAYVDAAPYSHENLIEGVTALEPVALADLTGDGVAEVVVAVWLYEGLAYTLYQLAADQTLQPKAECGCGC